LVLLQNHPSVFACTYTVGNGSLFLGSKANGAWRWLLIFI